MKWEQFTKRTNEPKLSWLERQLDAKGIAHRRHGESFHAPILQVDAEKIEEAWNLLPLEIDDLDDDHEMFQ